MAQIISVFPDTDEATEEAFHLMDLRAQLLREPSAAETAEITAAAAANNIPLLCCGLDVKTKSSTGVDVSVADQFTANGFAIALTELEPFLLGTVVIASLCCLRHLTDLSAV